METTNIGNVFCDLPYTHNSNTLLEEVGNPIILIHVSSIDTIQFTVCTRRQLKYRLWMCNKDRRREKKQKGNYTN